MPFDFATLRIPVIAAPMAGGVNTPALAAAVANAGGIGSFGFAYSTPEKISADLSATRQLTAGAINANFFIFSPVTMPDARIQQQALQAVKSLPFMQECAVALPQPPYYPKLEDMLVPIWHLRPEILTFHFGIPSSAVMAQAKALGIAVGITATCLTEAIAIEQAGADFIVAQGIEAGGHRGIFDPDSSDQEFTIDQLLAAIVPNVSIPVVAAGGLMDGHDVRRVLALGAAAAQLGTAFLGCNESGASPAHKAYLAEKTERGTMFTKAFSGRRARGIRNEFMDRMAGQVSLPFPTQNTLTGPLRALAVRRNDGEYQSLWAGSQYQRSRSLPAAELMALLQAERLGLV